MSTDKLREAPIPTVNEILEMFQAGTFGFVISEVWINEHIRRAALTAQPVQPSNEEALRKVDRYDMTISDWNGIPFIGHFVSDTGDWIKFVDLQDAISQPANEVKGLPQEYLDLSQEIGADEPLNEVRGDASKWVLTHNGKTVTGDTLMDVVRQGQSLRTEEETLIAHANLMKALAEEEQVVAWMRKLVKHHPMTIKTLLCDGEPIGRMIVAALTLPYTAAPTPDQKKG